MGTVKVCLMLCRFVGFVGISWSQTRAETCCNMLSRFGCLRFAVWYENTPSKEQGAITSGIAWDNGVYFSNQIHLLFSLVEHKVRIHTH